MSSRYERPNNNVSEELDISFEKSSTVIQNKDEVIRRLEKIDKDIIKFTQVDIKKLDNDAKLKILESFGNQTASSGLTKILDFYKDKLRNGKAPKDTNEVIGKLLSMINNYRITDLKLDSVMDGVLGRGASERGFDFKKNLDVSLGGVAELNHDAWEKTKGFIWKYMDTVKDAPWGVKCLVLGGSAIAGLVSYYIMTAKDEKTKEPYFLSKVFNYGLAAFSGFAIGNVVSELNERDATGDYEKLNKYVKSADYAHFFLGRKPNDIESRNAGAFIETVYNPRIHQLEFSEVVKGVKENKASSSEWVNMVDGKGVDVAGTHSGIEMFIHRYDPSYTGPESIYKNSEVDEKVKTEMKLLWKNVNVDRGKGDELAYRDVVLRFLALDPKFTFRNNRAEGNERYTEQERYDKKQAKYKELERIAGLDFATGWLEKKFNDPMLKTFFGAVPFSKEISESTPDFMSIYHRAQGEVSDLWVNIDEISNDREFEKYKKMSNDQNFSSLKKRLSFRKGVTLSKGEKVVMRQSHDNTVEAYINYENAFGVPSRDEFFENFEVKDMTTGKMIDKDSEAVSYVTLNPNDKTSKPERIVFPNEVTITAKKSVKLEDYVMYGYAIKFE